MPTPTRTSRRAASALSVVLLVLLTGCTAEVPELPGLERDPRQPSRFDLVPVEVADSLRGPPVPVGWNVQPPTGDLPGVLAVLVAGTDRAPEARFWTLDQGAATEMTAPPGLGADVSAVHVEGDDQLTVIASTRYQDGRLVLGVATSTDRASWETVALPDTVGNQALVETVVVDGTGYLVLEGPDLSQILVRVAGDGAASTVPLPPTDGFASSDAWYLAGAEEDLMMLRREALSGLPATWVGYRSTDSGTTWTRAGELGADEDLHVADLERVGDDYVAVGSDGHREEAAVWSTSDGREWDPETLDLPDQIGTFDTWDSVAGGATVGDDGSLVAPISCRCLSVAWAERDRDGRWQVHEEASGEADELEPAVVGWRHGEDYGGVVRTATGVSLVGPGRLDPVVTGEPTPTVDDVHELSGVTGVLASEHYFERFDDGWQQGYRASGYVYADGRIEEGDWPVDIVQEGFLEVSEAAPGEAQVALTQVAEDRGWRVDTAVSDGTRWSEPEELDGASTYEEVSAVVRDGGRWVTAVRRGFADADLSDSRAAAIYLSGDGRHWVRAEGSWQADSSKASAITDLCRTRDGAVVAYGWAETADGTKAAYWREGEERSWQRKELTVAGSSSFGSCEEAADGSVVLQGEARGTTTVWSSAGGDEFVPVDESDERVQRDDLVGVPGGMVAGGSWVSEDYRGPVVWLSEDGERWVAEPVPTMSGSDDIEVHRVGPELLVVATGGTGTTAWRIADIGAVMDRL